MIVLDSDHLSVLKYTDHSACELLNERMQDVRGEVFATTIVNIEEQMRGWLAQIKRLSTPHAQIVAYDDLKTFVTFFADWLLLPFDAQAADEFNRLRKERVRIGTMDLKIASIALVHDALLLSANLADFSKVPGLKVESWLD